MRARPFRKGFSKHLRRYLGEEIDDDWADEVCSSMDGGGEGGTDDRQSAAGPAQPGGSPP